MEIDISLKFFIVFLNASTIFAHEFKHKRSLFEPWIGPPNLSNYGSGAPWSDNPWKSGKISPELYPSPSKWSYAKPPPVIITKEIRVPVDKFLPVEVAKYVPYPVEKIVPVPVEKIVQIPVDRIVRVPVDRIVRVPVEVPTTSSSAPISQMAAIAQAPAIPASAPAVALSTSVPIPVQQPIPLMIRPGIPYTGPIIITAQGLSISTSGLIPSTATTMDQFPTQISSVSPSVMTQPITQSMASPMVLPMAAATPISNNSTVGISFILNSFPSQRLSQKNQGLTTYINGPSDVAPEPIQGNSLFPEVALNDYDIIQSLIRQSGSLRWKRNTVDDNNNTKEKSLSHL
ncbi:hypothetical protein PV327_007335 [Microctonus hyperodae]|uniref:Uncharacterized protein n=1 Tax=Microctonus hyperodae TaxID=165561 RepID=A0AA39F6C8_MICHY|nr:hypothetical protein PV327_007335 [Microctonus hyperodae]